jgi:SAM-dependent methyltransferase
VYTLAQVLDWFDPVTPNDVAGCSVLELGCGNASLMTHVASWEPERLHGVDLGESVSSATDNMSRVAFDRWTIEQADLVNYASNGFDLVYCIGVLHHLKSPLSGFDAVLRNVKPGGRFHCWVYAREGNATVIRFVEPIRKIATKLPWWVTKYFVATPLVVPFYLYAKLLRMLGKRLNLTRLPLFEYSLWVAGREFAFFRHVAFDQLVTPQTTYIDRATIDGWLSDPRIQPGTPYVVFRNGNSWKFGGVTRSEHFREHNERDK